MIDENRPIDMENILKEATGYDIRGLASNSDIKEGQMLAEARDAEKKYWEQAGADDQGGGSEPDLPENYEFIRMRQHLLNANHFSQLQDLRNELRELARKFRFNSSQEQELFRILNEKMPQFRQAYHADLAAKVASGEMSIAEAYQLFQTGKPKQKMDFDLHSRYFWGDPEAKEIVSADDNLWVTEDFEEFLPILDNVTRLLLLKLAEEQQIDLSNFIYAKDAIADLQTALITEKVVVGETKSRDKAAHDLAERAFYQEYYRSRAQSAILFYYGPYIAVDPTTKEFNLTPVIDKMAKLSTSGRIDPHLSEGGPYSGAKGKYRDLAEACVRAEHSKAIESARTTKAMIDHYFADQEGRRNHPEWNRDQKSGYRSDTIYDDLGAEGRQMSGHYNIGPLTLAEKIGLAGDLSTPVIIEQYLRGEKANIADQLESSTAIEKVGDLIVHHAYAGVEPPRDERVTVPWIYAEIKRKLQALKTQRESEWQRGVYKNFVIKDLVA